MLKKNCKKNLITNFLDINKKINILTPHGVFKTIDINFVVSILLFWFKLII